MIYIDTHTHLYLSHFDNDRFDVINRAVENGVNKMLLPNIDSDSIASLLSLVSAFPNHCIPMMGLHPTSIKNNYEEELKIVESYFEKYSFCAVGEIGIDLYWDKSFLNEQKSAFQKQIKLAAKHNLPVVIHSRASLYEIFEVLNAPETPKVKGVFHCYSGSVEEAIRIVDMGFLIGIGGVLTYNKSNLPEVVKAVGLSNIVLETDAPYLPPVPYRGKRNESAYLCNIAQKMADVLNVKINTVAEKTTENAINLFNINL